MLTVRRARILFPKAELVSTALAIAATRATLAPGVPDGRKFTRGGDELAPNLPKQRAVRHVVAKLSRLLPLHCVARITRIDQYVSVNGVHAFRRESHEAHRPEVEKHPSLRATHATRAPAPLRS